MVVAPSTRARRIEASKAPRDEELRLYLAMLLVAGAVVSTSVWAHESQHGEGAVRAGVFEVTSVVTTTGQFTVDYGHWPLFALMALALLFFVGDCAGSTAGSIKVVRHLVLARLLAARSCAPYIPSSCAPLDGAIIDQQALLAVIAFVLIYLAAFVLGTGVLALDAPFHGARAHERA